MLYAMFEVRTVVYPDVLTPYLLPTCSNQSLPVLGVRQDRCTVVVTQEDKDYRLVAYGDLGRVDAS